MGLNLKIKKITAIEIATLFIALIAALIYFSPKLMHKQEALISAKIKANNAMFTSKALEEFAQNPNAKSSEIAQKTLQELNKVTKNPYNNKEAAFTFQTSCANCNSVEYDDSLTMIILTTYNKNKELISRTVIKPPSFVLYEKDN